MPPTSRCPSVASSSRVLGATRGWPRSMAIPSSRRPGSTCRGSEAIVTDMDTPAGEGLRRRRTGGRAGHERHTLPQQRPWAQPRMRYAPTEVVSADELESIHLASLRVLSEIGMDFLDADARDALQAAGAQVEAGTQRVRFDPDMVIETIRTA